jgi:hypothetical protein
VVFTYRGGKAVSMYEYADKREALEAAGLGSKVDVQTRSY